jgi:hypothetical protein
MDTLATVVFRSSAIPENQVNTCQLKMVQVRLENLKLGLTENILIWI